jgi:hypothetical protein
VRAGYVPKDFLHMAMWTLLGMMVIGLVLVPLVRPSIVLVSLFFGWANGMVAFTAYRLVKKPPAVRAAERRARVEVELEMMQMRATRDAEPALWTPEAPRERRAAEHAIAPPPALAQPRR